MKKYRLQDKTAPAGRNIIGTYDSLQMADSAAREYVDEKDSDVTVFDLAVMSIEVNDPCDSVKTYEDACEVLGIEPMDEKAMAAAGFRPDEIARRKLETVTEALNDGWKPDWNNKEQDKWVPWFWIKPNKEKGAASAGLAYAYTNSAPTTTSANIGSRLCFKDARTARYAAEQFTELYALILVENY